jgi:hypothetical protein
MANTSLIGNASVHHVMPGLSRRGLIAVPTLKDTSPTTSCAISSIAASTQT